MKILIINLTNEPIDICLADASIVSITPHKPYILDSFHRPEINFWTSCTDPRFKVIVDQNEVLRYSRVVANQLKHSNATKKIQPIVVDNAVETTDEEVEKIIEESNIDVIKTASETPIVEETKEVLPEDVKTVDLKREELEKLTVASLKVLASRLEVQIPPYTKRKDIIEMLLKTEA